MVCLVSSNKGLRVRGYLRNDTGGASKTRSRDRYRNFAYSRGTSDWIMGSNSAALLPTLVIAVITFFGKPVENNVPKTFLVDLENNFTWHKKLQLDLTPELADNSGICSGEVLT